MILNHTYNFKNNIAIQKINTSLWKWLDSLLFKQLSRILYYLGILNESQYKIRMKLYCLPETELICIFNKPLYILNKEKKSTMDV